MKKSRLLLLGLTFLIFNFTFLIAVYAQVPADPSDLGLSPLSSSSIELIWTDNSGDENGFCIERRAESETSFVEVYVTGPDEWFYDDPGLHYNTTYFYRVRAYNGNGYSGYCAEQSAMTWNVVPADPSNLAVTVLSDSVIYLTWNDNSDNEDVFVVERKEEAGAYAEVLTPAANETSAQDVGLVYNTTYFYQMKARNGIGDSGYTNEDSGTTPNVGPNPPSELHAGVVSNTAVFLTWLDNSDNESWFKLERKEGETGAYSEFAVTDIDVSTFIDSGLVPGLTYYYKVRAYNEKGNSAYTVPDSITTDVPLAPSDPVATATSYDAADLSWSDNSNNETGFRIYRKAWDTGVYEEAGGTGENITAFSDSGLAPNTLYYYQVLAFNPVGNSPFSAEGSCITFDTIPLPPSGLAAALFSETVIDLVWTDNSYNESGFKVERKEWETGTYAEVGSAGAGETGFSDVGLAPYIIYYYRIFSHNPVGNSDYSNEDSAAAFAFPPAAPSGLTVIAVSFNEIDIAWTDNSDSELGFVVYRKAGETGSYSEAAVTGGDAAAFQDIGLDYSTAYYYKVTAFNPAGNSAFSNEDSDVTFDTIPAVPSGLIANAVSETAINLAWIDNSNNELGFVIERKTGAAGDYTAINTSGIDAVSYADSGLIAATLYYYRIGAFNAIGSSDYSSEAFTSTMLPTISETASVLTLSSDVVPADGFSACTVTVTVKGETGLPAKNKQVNVYSSRGTDTVVLANSFTDSNGQCTAAIFSDSPGPASVLAVCGGVTIAQNLILNPSFEENTEGWAMGASVLNSNPAFSYNGVRSCELEAAGSCPEGAYTSYFIPVLNRSFVLYRVSAYIKANMTVGNYYFSIFYYDANSAACSPDHTDIGSLTATAGWTRITQTFGGAGSGADVIFAANCAKIKIRATAWWNASGNSSGNGWTDSIRIARVPSVNFSPPPIRLVIASVPFTIPAGGISSSVRAEVQDNAGNKAWSYSGTITLSSSSLSGRFSLNKYNWADTSIIYLSEGAAVFYYKDTEVGNPVITVSRQPLIAGTQIETVELAVPSGVFSHIRASSGITKANGLNTVTLVVTVCNSGGYGLAGKTVTLSTARGISLTSISANPLVSDADGKCTFTVSSLSEGADTVAALCEEIPITRPSGSSLIAGYLFDKSDQSSVDDNSPFGNNGVLYGAVSETTVTSGRPGRAVWLNGLDGYISVPDAPSLSLVNAVTIMFWLKSSGANGAWHNVVRKWDTTRNYGIYLGNTDGNFSFTASFVGSPNANDDYSSGWSAWDGQWHHIAAVFDGQAQYINMFVDGDTKASIFVPYSQVKPNVGALILGDRTAGIIDEVRICSRALSQEEVLADYMGVSRIEFLPSVPSRLAILTPQITIPKNTPIPIQVEVRDADNDRCNFSDTFTVSTSSPGGAFSAVAAPWQDTTVIDLVSGYAVFYYKDSTIGVSVISVEREGLTGDARSETIIGGDVSGSSSYFRFSPVSASATGSDSVDFAVTVMDANGNRLPGKMVTLYTRRGPAYTLINLNPQPTGIDGRSVFRISSPYAGRESVIAVCDGETITGTVTSDVAAFYSFNDGTAKDNSLYGNNGSLSGTTVTDGKFGKALLFNGTSDLISVPDDDSLDLADVVSISLWMKAAGANGSYQDVVKKWAGEDRDYGIYLSIASGDLAFSSSFVGGIPWSDIGSGWSAWDNQWHHIVAIFDGPSQRVKVYVDTIEKLNTDVGYSQMKTNSDNLSIGSNFPGMLDEVKIFNKVLSPEEIAEDYASSFNGSGDIDFTATKFGITTPPFKIKAGSVSPKVVVAACGELGGYDSTFNCTVTVSSNSESRSFAVDKRARHFGATGKDTDIYLSEGQGFFYYRDYKGGNPMIITSNPGAGLPADAQTETISAFSMGFLTPQFEILNRESAVFIVRADNYSGETEVTFNETVILSSGSPAGRFSASNTAWQDITIAGFSSGILSLFYADKKGGNPEITISQPDVWILASQQETINMPVMIITTEQKNLKTNASGELVNVNAGDTVEYAVTIANSGKETMTGVIITDTRVFDTSVFSPVVFVSIEDTGNCDTWAYTSNLVLWTAGSPPNGANIKGLRWQFGTLGASESRTVRFRVRVK